MKSPREIVEFMLANDAYSQWLGIELLALDKGCCELKMTTRPEMLNGFHILHGGITYALADSALAFAANSFGKHALSVETSISHLAKVKQEEIIFAKAILIHSGKKFSSFDIKIMNSNHELVASFRGTVYNSEKEWTF